MRDDKKSNSAAQPGAGRLRRRTRRRGWLETAAAAFVLVAIIGGGYYGFYVKSRTDQLGDYYSRSLASGTEIAQQSINRIWLNLCNARNDSRKISLISGVTVLNQETVTTGDNPDWCDDDGSPELKAHTFFDRGQVIIEFVHKGVPRARVPLDVLLEPALPDSDFDRLLLSRLDGEVLYDRGGKSINIIRLPRPVSEETGAEIALGESTAVSGVTIAGKDFKLFSQPVVLAIPLRWYDSPLDARLCLAEPGGTDAGAEGLEGRGCVEPPVEEVWLLTGLKSPGDFRAEAMAISPSVVLATFALAVAALLSLPYLKLRFLGRREALRAHDVLVQFIALLVGATIGTFALLEIYARTGEAPKIGDRLTQINADISSAFRSEVTCLHAQLRSLTQARRKRPGELTRLLTDKAAGSVDLSSYPLLEMVYWMDRWGKQTQKWTVMDERTSLIDVSTRDYFRNALEGRFFPPVPSPATSIERECGSGASSAQNTEPGHYIESIRSRTTGNIHTVLSQRTGTASDDDTGTGVAAVLAPLLSVIEPTIPPGFSYAVIKRDGTVLFHSNTKRNLRENFFDELADAKELRAEVWARGTALAGDTGAADTTAQSPEFRLNYHARTHRAKLQPLDGTPWTLVSMYDVSAYRIARAEVLTFSAAVSLIYTAILLAVFAVLHQFCTRRARDRGTIFHRLWPCPEKHASYGGILCVTFVAALAWLAITVLLDRQTAVVVAALLGVLTFAIAFVTLYQADDDSRGPGPVARLGAWAMSLARLDVQAMTAGESLIEEIREAQARDRSRLYAASIVGVVLMISVFPPISFFRAANDEIMALFVMRDQLYYAEDLGQRSERIEERYQRISMSERNRAYIENLYLPESGCIGNAADIHTAQWLISLRDAGDATADDCGNGGARVSRDDALKLRLPLVAQLGPYLLGFVDESWELRALARDERRDWQRRGQQLVFREDGRKLRPRLSAESGQRLATSADSKNESAEHFEIAAPWPGLATPSLLRLDSWVALILAVVGIAMIWTLIGSLARLVFLSDLKRPYFLPVRSWSDIEGNPHTLILRGELDGEPREESETLLRIDSGQSMDLTPVAKLEKSGPRAKETTVIIDHFHTSLWDPEIAEKKLRLLERLLAVDCRIVIHSEVNPLHYLTMLSGDYVRGVANTLPDLGRWSAALDSFTRCREVLHEGTMRDELTERLLAIHAKALGVQSVDGNAERAMHALAAECWPDLELQRTAEKLAARRDIATLMLEDDDYLINQVLDLSEAHYRMLWSISGKDERMVLYRLATNGFASWRSHELVRRLLHRGLLYSDPSPRLMNQSFRRFVLDAELPEVFEQWTQEDGASAWVRLRTPMAVSLIGVFLFLFTTQPQLFSQSLAFTTAIAAILPTLIKVISVVAGSQKASAD